MSEYSHRHHYDDSSHHHHSHPREQTIEIPHHHHRHDDDDLSPRHLSREERRSRTLETEELDRHPPQHHHSPRSRDLILDERPHSVDRSHHQHLENRRHESPSFSSSDNIMTRSDSSREEEHHQHQHHHREIAFTEAEKAERREARKKRREKEERLEKAGLSWKQTAHNGGWIGAEILGAVAGGF